jgi:Helicase associated domain
LSATVASAYFYQFSTKQAREKLDNWYALLGHWWEYRQTGEFPPGNSMLGSWMTQQQRHKERKNGSCLTKEQVAALDGLGIEWNGNRQKVRESEWNLRYEELKVYRAEHGHCNVPQQYLVSFVPLRQV